MRYLIVVAHPDDEVLGCGATIARLADEGHDIHIAILGEGITSRYAKRKDADKRLVSALKMKAEKVRRQLGANKLYTFGLPDNRFDTVPLLDIVKVIEELVEKLKPGMIFTHHRGDLNIDHSIVHRAVLIATRPASNCPVREIYAFEVPSSTEWAFGEFAPFRPDVFFDIKEYLENKVKSLRIYETEVKEFPHPRSPEAIRHIAARWGSVVGLAYAEAFETIRRIV